MNDADRKALEDWKVSTPEIKYKFENGSLLQEMIAGEAWQACCEWRDSQMGEPVIYQCRTQPTWTDRQPWTPWGDCTKGVYEDCKRVRVNGDWRYESRALYTTPPAAQINQQLVEALDKLHAVVIAKNRAGADWGEQFIDLMVALSLAQAALNAAKSGDV